MTTSAPRAPAPTPTPAPVQLTVPYTPIAGAMAPFWLALDEGFLTRERLNVVAEFVSGSPPNIQGMMSGQYPVGLIGGGDGLLNRLGGGDILLIGTFYSVLAIDCYARPEMHSIAELKTSAGSSTPCGYLTTRTRPPPTRSSSMTTVWSRKSSSRLAPSSHRTSPRPPHGLYSSRVPTRRIILYTASD
ncbi:MAG TPA: hypothetical protein VK066_07115 [Chloroflexota bacterium]|nr:hypothetical protein [Chloroflexota bacterium]